MNREQREIIADMGPYTILEKEKDEDGRFQMPVILTCDGVAVAEIGPEVCDWDRAVVAALNEITQQEKSAQLSDPGGDKGSRPPPTTATEKTMPGAYAFKKDQYWAVKSLGDNGDLIAGKVHHVRLTGDDPKVYLTNLLNPGGKLSDRTPRVLADRNYQITKKQAMLIVNAFTTHGKVAARQAAAEGWQAKRRAEQAAEQTPALDPHRVEELKVFSTKLNQLKLDLEDWKPTDRKSGNADPSEQDPTVTSFNAVGKAARCVEDAKTVIDKVVEGHGSSAEKRPHLRVI